jgi:hypothetical protein
MTVATPAERSAAYDARKRMGGICIEGGCWRKAARSRVRCNTHLTQARENAKARRKISETLEISRDPQIIAAVRASQDAINRGEIIWDEEAGS